MPQKSDFLVAIDHAHKHKVSQSTLTLQRVVLQSVRESSRSTTTRFCNILKTKQKKKLPAVTVSFIKKLLPMQNIQEYLRQLLRTGSPSQVLGISLCLDALFGQFKQSANEPNPRCQSKSYIAPPQFNY